MLLDLVLFVMTSLPSPRVAPDAPIHRHELVSNLNGLRGILLSGGGELANQSRPVRLTVLSDADARGLFGNDHASYHTYQLIGGVIISSSLSYKFMTRSHVLCDVNFWCFWEQIVFSGWKLLDVASSNLIFGGLGCRYMILVPSTDMLAQSCCPLSCIGVDSFCSVHIGYGVFREIFSFFFSLVMKFQWFGGVRINWPSNRDGLFRRLDYSGEVKSFLAMIDARRPVADIIDAMLSFNAVCVSASSGIPIDLDVNMYSDLVPLLVQQLNLELHCVDSASCFPLLLNYLNVDRL